MSALNVAIRLLLLCNLITYLKAAAANITIDSRIVGGEVARDGQFPYQALLRWNNRPICGGTLIKDNYVLTAAHCVVDNGGRGNRIPAAQLSVRLGSTRVNTGGRLVQIAEVKVHPRYRFLINDVALLRIRRAVRSNPRIRPINPTNAHVRVGTLLTVSGWGATTTGGGMSDVLRYTQLPAITDVECYRSVQRDASIFCLGHPAGRGICQGDSGGPAVTGGVLVGVMSFTLGSCGSNNPDGFAKVSFLRDWIVQNSR